MANLFAAKKEATVEPYGDGKWSLRVTRAGHFVSASVHATREAAEAAAAKKGAAVK